MVESSNCSSSLQIEAIELPIDPKSRKRRGFIFISYKEEACVKKCLEKKYHNIQGGRVRIQRVSQPECDRNMNVSRP